MSRTPTILALVAASFLFAHAAEVETPEINRIWRSYAVEHTDAEANACSARTDEIHKKNQDMMEVLGCSLEPNIDICKAAMGISAAAALRHLKNRAAANAADLVGVKACGIALNSWLLPKAFAAGAPFCSHDIHRLRQLSVQASDELAELAVEQNKAIFAAIDDIPNTGSVSQKEVMQASLGNASVQNKLTNELIDSDTELKKVRAEITRLQAAGGEASEELVRAQQAKLKNLVQKSASGERKLGQKSAQIARRLGVVNRNSDLLIQMMAYPDATDNPKKMASVVNNLIDGGHIQGAKVTAGANVGQQARAALTQASEEYGKALDSYRDALKKYRANPVPVNAEALKKAETTFSNARSTRSRMFNSIRPSSLEGTNMPRGLRASLDNVYALERNLYEIEQARLSHNQMQRDLRQMQFMNKVDDATKQVRLFAMADSMANIPTASEETAKKLRGIARGVSTRIDFSDLDIQRAATREFNSLPLQERNSTSQRSARQLADRARTSAHMARQRANVTMGKISKIGVSKVVAGRIIGGVGAFALGPAAMAAEVAIELTAPGVTACDEGYFDPFVDFNADGGWFGGSCKPMAQMDDEFIAFASLPKEDLKLALKTYPHMCAITDQLHAEAAPPWKATCSASSITAERDDGLKYQINLNSDGEPSTVRVNDGKSSMYGTMAHGFRLNGGEVTSALLGTVKRGQTSISFDIENGVYREVAASDFHESRVAVGKISGEYADQFYGNLASVTGMANCCSGDEPRISDADCKRRFGIKHTGSRNSNEGSRRGSGNQ